MPNGSFALRSLRNVFQTSQQAIIDLAKPPFNIVDGMDITSQLLLAFATGRSSVRSNVILIPPGDFFTAPFKTPEGISLLGAGRNVSRLKNTGTAGATFATIYGSRSFVRGLTIDGQKANQLAGVGHGIQLAKPNSNTNAGAPTAVSGGLTLAGVVNPGDVSCTFTLATVGGAQLIPIVAGDVISFGEGANVDVMKVANTYVPGSVVVTFTSPFLNAYTTNATVALCVTNSEIADSTVFATYFMGISLWHTFGCRAQNNHVFDFLDTGIDLEEGAIENAIDDNLIESGGRYGIALDASIAALGQTRLNAVTKNRIRLQNGGQARWDPLNIGGGYAHSGVWCGNADQTTISKNLIDISRAGTHGILLTGNAAQGKVGTLAEVEGNQIVGNKAPSTWGIRFNNPIGANLASATPRPLIATNIIRGVDRGIDIEDAIDAQLLGDRIFDSVSFGVIVGDNNTQAQDVTVALNLVDGVSAGIGIQFTGSAGADIARVASNSVRNTSGAKYAFNGWTRKLADDVT